MIGSMPLAPWSARAELDARSAGARSRQTLASILEEESSTQPTSRTKSIDESSTCYYPPPDPSAIPAPNQLNHRDPSPDHHHLPSRPARRRRTRRTKISEHSSCYQFVGPLPPGPDDASEQAHEPAIKTSTSLIAPTTTTIKTPNKFTNTNNPMMSNRMGTLLMLSSILLLLATATTVIPLVAGLQSTYAPLGQVVEGELALSIN